jgi:hypothetical protein
MKKYDITCTFTVLSCLQGMLWWQYNSQEEEDIKFCENTINSVLMYQSVQRQNTSKYNSITAILNSYMTAFIA